jgi:hypothetical protein
MNTLLEPRLGALQLVLMTVGLFVAYEVCFRIGRRRRDDVREARRSQAEVAVAALLALLGLLLAFSFGIGAARFDKRRDLVLEEANAIGTTYLRAGMLPAPHGEHVEALLREYVGMRMGVKNAVDLERAVVKSGDLHAAMWAEATAVARAEPTPITALFVASLNNLIDLHQARITVALYQRIPPAVFASLYVVALLAIGMVGLRAGLDRSRGLSTATILIAAIMSVMALIASLDDPQSHLFDINKHALQATKRTMEAGPTASVP